ncbi:hypothetical protein K432DRAFT_8142 [Lepidopterella palustris CBS 459.81]|uniref:LsmAD domain-containing protein n=1 Tax=Lepidopterella palustris CBS 459.81 TaxID=1314670 RepID=A0A8E2EDE4_9PEZI|nr:hypothetical protein K432DRAFT_8142 [Lepidopterella palustris CBS 459.81]
MSTTTQPPSVNGASNANGSANPTTTAPSAVGRAQLKMSTSGKAADAARKQAGSPIDGNQRKPPTQRAWTQGTNPITQRLSNPNSNGVVNASKPAPNPQSLVVPSGETASPMRHMSDRMTFLLANFTGLQANITLKNGEKYTGVFSGASLDPAELRYVFKMVKRVQLTSDSQVNGMSETVDDYVGVGDTHVMTFDIGDVADLNVQSVVLDKVQAKPQNGLSTGFRTDADISGNVAFRERTLKPWEPSSDTNAILPLDESGKAGWDQFATNEKLFGVQSNYDESFYTTTIDRSNPLYQERAARAERIAREIESSSSMNTHVREERGQVVPEDKGVDEEEKYSGVRREFPPLSSGQSNKYTPPARRAPTGQPTVPGAPVDPAIISAQIARPDSALTKPPATANAIPAEKRTTPEITKSEEAPKSKPLAPVTAEPTKAEPPKAEPTKAEPTKAEPTKAEPTKADPTIDIKTTTAAKAAPEPSQKPSAALKPSVGNVPASRKAGRPDNNATANVEHELLDSFKQFSATEKLRVQERQRSMARESKAVKLNDLKKFSQNFKLHTPVPQDLVPILAKDENKQLEIVEKALRTVQELKSTPPKAAPVVAEQKAPRAGNGKPDTTHTSPTATAERQNMQRQRNGQNNYGSASMRVERSGQNQNMNQTPARSGPGLLSQRLAITQQQHKAGTMHYNNIPHPLPIQQDMRIAPPTGPSASSSGVQTPTSSVSTRFNVRAPDFKPNPNANAFTPGGNPSAGSSPRPNSAARPEPRKAPTTSFFGSQKPNVESLSFDDAFNPIKRMVKEVQALDENKRREFAANGGIPQPYRTPPTWDVSDVNKEKSYVDMFERAPVLVQPISAPHNSLGNGPHTQHQLPPHLQQVPQNVPQAQTPHHTPRHPPVQPHGQGGPHHFDGHHMQFSQSASSVHPSPRVMPPYVYSGQSQAIPVFQQQPPMQAYGMSPSVQHVALRQPQPQFVNGPGPAMGGHMMTNQPSGGPFMAIQGNPQMQMYSGPGQPYPHYAGQMPAPPGANGYPSPRPGGAQMMSHQGSQQGHQSQPLVYMQHGAQMPPMFAHMPTGPMTPMRAPYTQPHQPHYGSPHQHHPFPQQPHRGTPSASYSQPMMQQHSMPPQGPPPTGPAAHGPEGGDELK